MPRQKLSVIVLTKNEEKNIAPCLDTVRWADEVIVIDDNSEDGTVDIARQYTRNVVVHPLNNDFSAQRNFGNDRANGDWILQMDADERVGEMLRRKIEDVLDKGSDFSAFRFGRRNNFCGKFLKYGGTGTHKPVRIFKRGMAKFAGENIHENLKVDGAIGDIDAAIDHYNFPTISHYIETQNFYTDLEAKALLEAVGTMSPSALKRELIFGPLKLFIKIYFKKQGYRDGLHGLIFSVLSSWRRFLIYAKYWELNKEFYDEK